MIVVLLLLLMPCHLVDGFANQSTTHRLRYKRRQWQEQALWYLTELMTRIRLNIPRTQEWVTPVAPMYTFNICNGGMGKACRCISAAGSVDRAVIHCVRICLCAVIILRLVLLTNTVRVPPDDALVALCSPFNSFFALTKNKAVRALFQIFLCHYTRTHFRVR